MAERAEPTRDEIARDYAKALAIIDNLRATNAELLAALKALVNDVEAKDNPRDEGASSDSEQMRAALVATAKAEGR